MTKAPLLRAMARTYANGHRWDHLDGEAVTAAADEIDAALAVTAPLPRAVTETRR